MYDNIVWKSKSWWNKLHKDLKIIAYSKKISDHFYAMWSRNNQSPIFLIQKTLNKQIGMKGIKYSIGIEVDY